MANKYLFVGNTYCGDGTTSAAAASNGAAGAWNNLNVFTGTAPAYGALAAGDVVTMRALNSSGVALSLATGTSYVLGSAAATSAAPICWILDNGVTWSGINGSLTVNVGDWCTTTIQPYNEILAAAADTIIVRSNDLLKSTAGFLIVGNDSLAKNFKIDFSSMSSTTCTVNLISVFGTLENANIVAVPNMSSAVGLIYHPSSWFAYSHAGRVINPQISLSRSGLTQTPSIFQIEFGDGGGGSMDVIGGTVTGAASTEGYWSLVRQNCYGSQVNVMGLSYPKQMPSMSPIAISGYQGSGPVTTIIGADNGFGSFIGGPAIGYVDSRNLLYNYPTLNAVLPDSGSTPWSWRGVPRTTTQRNRPLSLNLAKVFADTSTPATRTVTVDMLISSTVPTANKDRKLVWMTVSYVRNSDSKYITETTQIDIAGTALTTSSASWSAVTWGSVACTKYALTLTTANAIKPDSLVIVNLFWAAPSTSADDIFFVCPDTKIA